jgi:ParB family chromosome partitioning protein
MAKRTGLGRGIGALIPTGDSAEARPVDVFFPGASSAAAAAATVESRDAGLRRRGLGCRGIRRGDEAELVAVPGPD